MEIHCECIYCGYTWNVMVTSRDEPPTMCAKTGCRDRNIKYVEWAKIKIDAYKGCPPFPPKSNYGNW